MAEERKNYYEILGIPATAGPDEIRAVYRRLAFQFHPDRNSDPAAQEYFQQVIEAFSVLSDPDSRRDYDAILFSDETLITSAIASSLSAGDLYDSVAQKTGNQRSISERDQYLIHLKKSRRRRATLQTVISIIIILLLLFYGFKPLRTSSEGVAPTSGTSSSGLDLTGSTENSTSNRNPGTSLNQNLVVIQGAAGLQGIPGPAGRDGRIGIDGVPGPAGANGADGAQGPAGANGKDGAVGPAGPAGPTGAPGANGASGAAGAQGPAGANGAAGATGAAGAPGAKGDQGDRGPAGQDATVYTVKPNLGGAAGMIAPCNQDLSDTSTAPGLDVTIDTRFDPATEKYMIAAINLKGFTSACRGVLVGINMVLASNASAHPNAVFQCTKTLPANFTAPYTYSFVSGGTDCTKYSGSWGSSGALDLGIVVASDLARINLIVSG